MATNRSSKTGRVRRTMSARDAATEKPKGRAPKRPASDTTAVKVVTAWDQVAVEIAAFFRACTAFIEDAHDEFNEERSK